MTRLLAILMLLPAIASAAGLGVYNPAQHAVNGFMPTQLPDCYLWVCAGNAGLTNGASVIDVQDFSKNLFQMKAGSSAQRPVISSFNGRQVFQFDGVDDRMSVTNFDLYAANWNAGFQVIVVAAYTNANSGLAGIATLVDAKHGSRANLKTVFVLHDLTKNSGVNDFNFGTGTTTGYAGIDSTNFIGDRVARVISGFRNGTNMSLNVNGIVNGTAVNIYTTNSIQNILGVGYYDAEQNRFVNGFIAEIIVIANTIDLYQRLQVQRYLGTKYGIVVQ